MPDKRRKKRAATEKDLEDLSTITPSDIEDAKVAWQQDASPEFRDLLDATPDDQKGNG